MAGNGSYKGRCFCGAVELETTGEPAAMGYCHCSSCREWSAAPVNAFSLWPMDAVRIVKGRDDVASYQKSENSIRRWCRACGGHVLTEHPKWGLTDVYAAVIPAMEFRPMLHVNYQETVLPMKDGLPKQRDLPLEMGGTGELVPE
ncbi:GFA family protein [Ensifer sp. LCM 4579]|uniref:GFA family protein n=1 Tax=Ensifer sp. LCM 4579 TaxID=1848292 RepID=UPI0008DA19AF|nr:GFA family protein [Ensifer sp. LCM 4579]OHV72736.1 aldehyde-activating protein [Ensifer sp. LCM 4579]